MYRSAEQNTGYIKPVSNPIDVYVGYRLRQRRVLLGLSQTRLAESLDLTFQQIQKYESGLNRIGASRLYQLACILDTPVGYFFDGIPPSLQAQAKTPTRHDDPGPMPLPTRETLELIRAYQSLPDPQIRRHVHQLLKSLASALDDGTDTQAPAENNLPLTTQ